MELIILWSLCGSLGITCDEAKPEDRPTPFEGFVANVGQWKGDFRFRAQYGSMMAWFERNTITLSRRASPEESASTIRLRFQSPLESTSIEPENTLPGELHFFQGNDPSRWVRGVGRHHSILYRELYPGIDVRFREQEGELEYDILLEEGARCEDVVIVPEGMESLRIEQDGSLVIETTLGDLCQEPPQTWETLQDGTRREIECRYRLVDSRSYGFELRDQSGDSSVIIDPGLSWSTYLGGSAADFVIQGAAQNARGDVFLAGWSTSWDFPSTIGQDEPSVTDEQGFLSVLSADGSSLIFGMFFGGSDKDHFTDLALDGTGAIYLCGVTASVDLPITPFPYQSTHLGGGSDGFVTKIDLATATPVFSTYLGGDDADRPMRLSVENDGAVVLGGRSKSENFLRRVSSGFDLSHNGHWDLVLCRLSADGKRMLNGTYVGGGAVDGNAVGDSAPFDLCLDQDGAVIAASVTRSFDFPTLSGAYDETYNGLDDVVVIRLDHRLENLLASTFLGSDLNEFASTVAIDRDEQIVVAGSTNSPGFPTTPGAFDTTFNSASTLWMDGFVSRFSKNLDVLSYSTFIGGEHHDVVRDLELEQPRGIVLTGMTDSLDFPVTPDAYQPQKKGPSAGIIGQDAMFFSLDMETSGAAGLLYSTFLGGQLWEDAHRILHDRLGAYTIIGGTASDDFPVTPNAFDETLNAAQDLFVTRFCLGRSANYGDGWPGTIGIPRLMSTAPQLDQALLVSLDNSLGSPTQGLMFVGLEPSQSPTIWEGTLLVSPSILLPLSIPGGGLTIGADLSSSRFSCGSEIYLQALQWDPGATRGVAFTRGLMLAIGG